MTAPPDELEIPRSVGSKGEAYANTMAEARVATFRSELVDAGRVVRRRSQDGEGEARLCGAPNPLTAGNSPSIQP
jgi:hypothetical protein